MASPTRDADEHGDLIRRFLAAVIPLRGCAWDDDDGLWAGRDLIEELSRVWDMGEPDATYRWTVAQCADVIRFIHCVEPVNGQCFCNDTHSVSATCGWHAVMEFAERQMRQPARARRRNLERHAPGTDPTQLEQAWNAEPGHG